MDSVFKVGDKVYDHQYGWGEVIWVREDYAFPVGVRMSIDKEPVYTADGRYTTGDLFPRLSFTEYDFVKGGFSQERPKIKKGQLVYVRCGRQHD